MTVLWIGYIALAVCIYLFGRGYLAGYWEMLAAFYVRWYQDMYPMDGRVTLDCVNINTWLILCPWKWHVRHVFPPPVWELLRTKLHIV